MATLAARHFDTLSYVKEAKSLGTSEELAELQARKIEEAIDIAVSIIESKEVAKKYDLVQTELRLIKWMIGIGFVSITSISGVIYTLIKLMLH